MTTTKSPTARFHALRLCEACDRPRQVIKDSRGGVALRCTRPHCYHYGPKHEQTIPGRTYGALRKSMAAERIRYDRDRLAWYSVPRFPSGAPLRISPDLRKAWGRVRSAKTRPAFIRRGQEFLELLGESMRTTETDPRQYTAPAWDDRKGRTTSGFRYTSVSVPTLETGPGRADLLGRWQHGIMSGHRIWVGDVPGPQGLDSMRATLVHEIQHWLDHYGQTSDSRGHSRLWDARLAALTLMLHPKPRAKAKRR